jgi:hypothetical protein
MQLSLQLLNLLIFYFWCFQIPYDTMTPLQAAVGVRQVGKERISCYSILCAQWNVLNVLSYQGLRPGLPKKAHPKLLDIMQRCWEADPSKRPAFPDILVEVEDLLSHVQVCPGISRSTRICLLGERNPNETWSSSLIVTLQCSLHPLDRELQERRSKIQLMTRTKKIDFSCTYLTFFSIRWFGVFRIRVTNYEECSISFFLAGFALVYIWTSILGPNFFGPIVLT